MNTSKDHSAEPRMPRGGTRFDPSRPPLSTLRQTRPERVICQAVRLMTAEFIFAAGDRIGLRRERRRLACHIRQIAMYVCHVALQMTMTTIGDGFGRTARRSPMPAPWSRTAAMIAISTSSSAPSSASRCSPSAISARWPMTENATKAVSQLLRFLKSLPPAGGQICATSAPKTGSSVATLELQTPTARLRVAPAILLLAARQGLIARDGARIRPLPEAQAFIARHETPEPDFARPHRDLTEATIAIGDETARVTRNLSESPLSALERLKGRAGEAYFPREAVAAGERLHADFTRGQLQPQITMRFEPRLGTNVKGARAASPTSPTQPSPPGSASTAPSQPSVPSSPALRWTSAVS